ncbi:MAG: hypothetical protein FWF96_01555, partial [Kiritimatiellaeota bacterium]|nr:hypothetical protein [Kiritimatiellota bacterium]
MKKMILRVALGVYVGIWVFYGVFSTTFAAKERGVWGGLRFVLFGDPPALVMVREGEECGCEGVGAAGKLGALYARYEARQEAYNRKDPGTWHYVPDAFVDAHVLPYAVRTNAVMPSFSTNAVVVRAMSTGSRGRGNRVAVKWPEGIVWGDASAGYASFGLLDSGRVVFGFQENTPWRENMTLPFASAAPVVTLAPLHGDWEARPGEGSRIWHRQGVNALVVVWERMFLANPSGDPEIPTNAVSFALVVERSPGNGEPCDFRYVYGAGVTEAVLARTVSGAQFLDAGFVLHGPDWNPLEIGAGVSLRLLGLGDAAWADADPSGAGINRVGCLLFGIPFGLRNLPGMMAPVGWLWENGLCVHDPETLNYVTPGGVSIN